uniref:BED-type domain-containing protein n=1 Tax=Pseudonaja textilis TaxID=8673 RepID=A0A670ZKJ7_PSETE
GQNQSTIPLLEGTQNVVALSQAESHYWTFFGFQGDAYGRILDKSKIICKICGVQLSYNGNTSSLRQHLFCKHRCEYIEVLKVANRNKGIAGTGEFGTPRPPVPSQTTQAIADFIVLDLMPMEVVEGEGFGKMLAVLDPNYKSPEAAAFAHTVLKDMYTQVKGKIWELVRALPQCSLSLDIWCHSSTLTYLTLTAHYVDDCFEPQARVLSSRPIPENPSTESLVESLTEATKEWGVHESTLYTMGGIGPVFQQAAAALGWTALPCIGQVLRAAMEAVLNQPVAQSALESLRHLASWALTGTGRSEKLWFQEPLLQTLLSRFLRDGSRWHTVYTILQDLLKYSKSLSGLGPDGEAILHPQDWAALKDTVQVLKPMAIATSTFTKHPFSSLALVKPVLTSLLYKHLVASEWDSALALEAKEAAQKELNYHFSRPEVNQVLNLACALDPRFHCLDFLSHSDRMETLRLLKTEVSHLAEASAFLNSSLPDAASSSPPSKMPKQDTGIEFLLGDLCSIRGGPGINSAHQQAEQEVASFQVNEASALTQEPLQWWKIHHTQYPLLAQAARKLLGVPATSVPAGWLFSSTGDAIHTKRQALTPEHVDMLVFLHGNHISLRPTSWRPLFYAVDLTSQKRDTTKGGNQPCMGQKERSFEDRNDVLRVSGDIKREIGAD